MKVEKSWIRTGRLHLQEITQVLISVWVWAELMAIVRPEGLSHGEIPVTPPEIEPVTFQHVARVREKYLTFGKMDCFNNFRLKKYKLYLSLISTLLY